MEKLLSALKNIPEYKTLLGAVEKSQSAAVTGIGQINRSHIIAGLGLDSGRPIVTENTASAAAFFHLAHEVADAVERRNAELPPTEKVEIKH